MKKIVLYALILVTAISCTGRIRNSNEAGTRAAVNVSAVKSELKNHRPKLNVSGTAYAEKEANLGSALPGRVEREYFSEGSHVNRGDLLVSMSGEMLAQAMTEHGTVEKDFQRVSRLLEKGSITQQEYDHVKSLFEASSSRLEMVRKNSEITAPFPGTIVEYLVKEGENYFFNLNLDPGYSKTSGILRLMKLDPIVIEAEVNEKELGSIRNGFRADVTFDAIPDTVFPGVITSISPMLSSVTHTAKVKIAVSNSRGLLRPGMYAKAAVILPEVSSVTVPLSTIFRQSGTADDYVFTVNGRNAVRRRINTEWVEGSEAGIKGINAGDMVVTAGKDKLIDGSLIEVNN